MRCAAPITQAMVLVALALPATAHEIGTTRATVLVHTDGTYQVDLAVDPDGLLTKLEVYGGAALSSTSIPAERDRRIVDLAPVFMTRVQIQFDGIADRPQFQYFPPPVQSSADPVECVVRLTGRIPVGALDARLSNGLALGAYAVTVQLPDRSPQTFWVIGATLSPPLLRQPPGAVTRTAVARQYFALGYTHILPEGIDHILFVLGIFLLNVRWRSILSQVSAFTVAHSITLGLTMYGGVSLPPRIVEPMIAVSIAYIAIENLFMSDVKAWRIALVFIFGLLHGMGFAGVLKDLGLPRSEFLTGLLTFNAGVEAGQISVLLLAFALVAYWRSDRTVYRRFIVQPASLAIAAMGLYWTIERALGM